jgi:hypothetical protein
VEKIGGWVESRRLARDDSDVSVGLHGVTERPVHAVGVPGIDVLVHNDDDLSNQRIETRGSLQNLPRLGGMRFRDLDDAVVPHSRAVEIWRRVWQSLGGSPTRKGVKMGFLR